jgi:hypothetical protein
VAKTHPEPDERFEQNIVIAAPPAAVFDCFFKADALRAWWQALRSVTTPVTFGVYAVEWAPTPYRDDILGTLGGVFHGTVVEARPGHQFLVADAYWVPHVRQDGYEASPRWRRYYAVVARGWQVSLIALKRYAEDSAEAKGPKPDVRS